MAAVGAMFTQTDLVIDNLAEPLAIPVKHKPIHADILVVGDAGALDQPRLVTKCAQGRHQPAVAVPSLADIIRRGTVDVELGVIKDISHPLD